MQQLTKTAQFLKLTKMKKLLLLLIPLFGMLTVESNAQAVFNSTCRLPITKGDSVLIATGWDDYGSQSLGVTGVEYKGLYTPDETEKAKKRFAFVVYPEATRIIDPTVYKKGREESLYETFKKFGGEIQFMVVVVDKDGIHKMETTEDMEEYLQKRENEK